MDEAPQQLLIGHVPQHLEQGSATTSRTLSV
jgi:hypothetical protein